MPFTSSRVGATPANVQSVEEIRKVLFNSGLCQAIGTESGDSQSFGTPVTGSSFVCGHASLVLFHTISATPIGAKIGTMLEGRVAARKCSSNGMA